MTAIHLDGGFRGGPILGIVLPQFCKLTGALMKIKLTLTAALVVVLAGCASPTVVQSVKAGDSGLTCPQLQNEYQDAEALRAAADKEKGMTGGNIARALLFWPAILGSFSNANEAIAAADARRVNLANLMNQKGCPIPASAAPAAAPEKK
jgi:hypothetical protein